MTRRSVAEHVSHITDLLQPLDSLPAQKIALGDALGRLLAEDIHSPVDLPVFRNSQMDGYALDASSMASVPVTLPVRHTIAAGDSGAEPHIPGTAIKIMTGAPIPAGADCVVPVEDTDTMDGRVTILRARSVGEFIREAGSDIPSGALVLAAGVLLAPRHIAVLAAIGLRTVLVRRRPRVAVITTGTELVDAGSVLGPGQIYDSNGIALATVAKANGAEIVSIARSNDDPAKFRLLLTAATDAADLVLTSGGVSMGDFEVVKEVLAPLGGEFGHVAMQPGGPQGTTVVNGTPVLSFPGNPVSTMVSFEVFARPLLRRAAGLPDVVTDDIPLAESITSVPNKRQFLRGRRTDGAVELVAGPGSHLVAAMAWADVLIDVPAEVRSLPAGSNVRVLEL